MKKIYDTLLLMRRESGPPDGEGKLILETAALEQDMGGKQESLMAVLAEDKIGLGTCRFTARGRAGELSYKIIRWTGAPLILETVKRNSEMDFTVFESADGLYEISVEYSGALLDLVYRLVFINKKLKPNDGQTYQKRQEEDYLSGYAQHNENCEKMWGLSGAESERGEFQRDRERIVNSKAFRRLVDKAQIFTSSKGDYYRTRMTHTLEVAQISRSIANSLRLNIDLTEAIALAHDLGHTPFGHQGERSLDDILNYRIALLPGTPAQGKNPYGGFKHSFQSLRVLTVLEEKYVAFHGLDVSFQVLEGALKHTGLKTKNCVDCKEKSCKAKCCDPKEFIAAEFMDKLYLEYPFATTLEGQVVAIADEIAQRGHDIDDSLTGGLLTNQEFRDYLSMKTMEPLRKKIEKSYQEVEQCRYRSQISEKEMLGARIISDIIGYLVNDVVKATRGRIKSFVPDEFYNAQHRYSRELIGFSGEGLKVCRLLEKLISKKAVNCQEVTRFDRNADRIVQSLFRNYYRNPKLMHDGTLIRLYYDMLDATHNAVSFVDGELELIRKEIDRITFREFPSDKKEWTAEDEEYWIKRRLLVRNITDYIAGMTDSYAINEYQALMD